MSNEAEVVKDEKDNVVETKKDDVVETKKDDVVETKKDDVVETKKDDVVETKNDDVVENKADDVVENEKNEAEENAAENKADDVVENEKNEAEENAAENKADNVVENEKNEAEENEKDDTAENKEEEVVKAEKVNVVNTNEMNALKQKKEKSYSRKIFITRVYRTLVCIFFCILSLFPFYTVIINATLDSGAIQQGIHVIPGDLFSKNWNNFLENVNGEAANVNLFTYFKNSAIIAVCTTGLAVYFSTMTAYGLHVYNFKLKKLAWTFILGIMMIPVQVSMIGFVMMMIKVNLNDSFIPIIIPAVAAPSTVFFMRQYMKTGLPLEIVEAARIDGSNELRTFNLIALPLMKPAVATQAIFAFIASWNNLYTPTMFITSKHKFTLPMFVQGLASADHKTDYGMVYMGIFITILPLLVVYMLLSKYIIAGVALGGVKE